MLKTLNSLIGITNSDDVVIINLRNLKVDLKDNFVNS